jgi:hypothetical protein
MTSISLTQSLSAPLVAANRSTWGGPMMGTGWVSGAVE